MEPGANRTLIMICRACGVLALAAGIAYWMGYGIPLDVHMGLGALLVLALWALAFKSRAVQPGLSLVATMWGALVPILGFAQIMLPLGDAPWLLQILHVAAGVGAIGFAEVVAKRGMTAAN